MSDSISGRLTLVMAAAAGFSVANIYFNQPLLGLMEREFGKGGGVGFIPSFTQLGFAIGLVLLVPLGDTLDRRRLILLQAVGLVLSLAAAALAPTAPILVLASILVGVLSTIAQQIIPFAVDLAPLGSRGRVVGTVMTGLLAGILLARTLSGFVGAYFGWRAMFWAAAFAGIFMSAILAMTLPRGEPRTLRPYGTLLHSLLDLVRAQSTLRRAVLVQGALFAGFSAFWTTLALLLQGPPFHLGSEVAGLFGIVGLVGITVSPLAGRISDARGPYGIQGLGILTVLSAFALLFAVPTIPGLMLGAALLDAGLMMAMVSHQTVVFALDPGAPNRINTVYMTGLFLAGATGSAAASMAWNTQGWRGVTGLGVLLALIGLSIHLVTRLQHRLDETAMDEVVPGTRDSRRPSRSTKTC